MTIKTGAITLALAAVTLLPLVANAAGGASTPDGVFDNFRTAMKNKDYKAGFAQMTPDSQDMMLGGMAMAMNMGFGIDPAKAPDAQKLVEKYGIKKMDPTKMQPGQDPRSLVKDTVQGVKDKPACFAELMGWMEANAAGPDRAAKMEAYANSSLQEVKTEGDTATATVKVSHNGQDNSSPIAFKKIDGTWYIDLAAAGDHGGSGKPAAPPSDK